MNISKWLKTAVTTGLMAASLLGATAQAQTATGKTELLWLGQASFRITTPGGKTIVIDPWLSGGPKTPAPYKTDLSALGKVDLLLVTHAHVDHIGDAPAIAKLNNTVLYTFAPDAFTVMGQRFTPTRIMTRQNSLVVSFEPAK